MALRNESSRKARPEHGTEERILAQSAAVAHSPRWEAAQGKAFRLFCDCGRPSLSEVFSRTTNTNTGKTGGHGLSNVLRSVLKRTVCTGLPGPADCQKWQSGPGRLSKMAIRARPIVKNGNPGQADCQKWQSGPGRLSKMASRARPIVKNGNPGPADCQKWQLEPPGLSHSSWPIVKNGNPGPADCQKWQSGPGRLSKMAIGAPWVVTLLLADCQKWQSGPGRLSKMAIRARPIVKNVNPGPADCQKWQSGPGRLSKMAIGAPWVVTLLLRIFLENRKYSPP